MKTYENDLKEHFLIDLHELLIPLLNIGGLLARIGVIVGGGLWIGLVVLAPFDNLLEDRLVDLCTAASVLRISRGGEVGYVH
jgi:hypothetical protein